MKSTVPPSRLWLAAGFCFILISVYLLTFNGLFRSIQEPSMLAVAEYLAQTGSLDPRPPGLLFNPFHHQEGFHEPGQSFLALPLYLVSARLPGVGNVHMAMFLNVLLTAATGALIYLALGELGYSNQRSLGVASIYGLGTISWPYARTFLREPAAAFLYVLAFIAFLRLRRTGHHRWAVLCIGALLLSVAFKFLGLVALTFFTLAILLTSDTTIRHRAWRAAAVVLLSVVGLVISMAVAEYRGLNALGHLSNYLRVFTSVNGARQALVNLYGLTLSPGKGIFVFSPALLLGLVGLFPLWRTRKWEAFVVSGVILFNLTAYSFSVGWDTGLDWGLRLLVPMVPFLTIPIAALLDGGRAWRWIVVAVSLGSTAIQFVASTADWVVYYFDVFARYPHPELTIFRDWRYFFLSPVVGQFLIWRPENFDLIWWRAIRQGEPPVLSLGILATLLFLLAVAIAFWFYIRKPRPWRQSLTALMIVTGVFLGGTYVFLRQAYWVNAVYWDTDTVALRQMAGEINRAPGRRLIVSVSHQFHYNLFMNYLKGSFLHYWFSPEQKNGFAALRKPLGEARDVYLILDHIPPGSTEGEHLLQWLDETAHRREDKWYGGYRFYRYASPLPTETRWRKAQPTKEDIDSIPHKLGVDFGHGIRLLGYDIVESELRPGRYLYVTLFWQALAPMGQKYVLSLQVLGPGEQVLGQEDVPPGRESYPTTEWTAGELVADTYAVPIVVKPEEPLAGRIQVAMYTWLSQERLPVRDSSGAVQGDRVFLGPVRLLPFQAAKHNIPHQLDLNMGNRIQLVGYGLSRQKVAPGESLHLTLYWQATSRIQQDYTVFTHLLGEDNLIRGQRDNQPAKGSYPTSLWSLGEVVKDEYEIPVAAGAPPGRYRLEVGMYLLSTGERLPVLDEKGSMADNRILLPVTVQVVRK